MNKLLTLALLSVLSLSAKAQNSEIPVTQPFGKVNQADLEMTKCDFEPDANAMVLFDKAHVFFDIQYNINTERHKRIKIFNDKGKGEADIRIEYITFNRAEYITGLQAQTINLENGKPEIIKIDKKQIFIEPIDKYRSAMVFSFPNVKPGSVIEYKYTLGSTYISDFPNWYFQSDLPTRYSEIGTDVPDIIFYKRLENRHYPYVVDKLSGNTHTQALANIPSLKDEPYMGARNDNSERILFQLLSVKAGFFPVNFSDTWKKVGENFMENEDFGEQISRKLPGEEVIIAKAKTLKTDDEKIAYIFNTVKNELKWNDFYYRYTDEGTVKAWNKKSGNSAEINLALTHLLQKAGLKVLPMLVSTRNNGHVNPAFPTPYQFNNVVAYIPVDSAKSYVLDATNKYNLYNEVPKTLLNSFGFYMNKKDEVYDLEFLHDNNPVKQVILINAEIKPDGKMTGTSEISSYAYNKINTVTKYKTDGEKKYIEYLSDNDNNLKISSVKFEDMDVDTLPLRQKIDFNLDLNGSDDSYIYFNSNLFGTLKNNPFLNEKRVTDIDFGYRDNYSITGLFKLPVGYKIDALPKSISMSTPDGNIVFKRIVAEQDGSVIERLIIDHEKSLYFKEDYDEFHEFCKKMYELLNEQIVLKKS